MVYYRRQENIFECDGCWGAVVVVGTLVSRRDGCCSNNLLHYLWGDGMLNSSALHRSLVAT